MIRRGFGIYKSPSGSGKQIGAGSGQGHWRTYGVPEGLAHNVVRSMVQDREGFLWFGTSGGGVSRYDGETFTTFTTQDGLAHNGVLSIFQDREGLLWFGTSGGVSRYDGETFTTFTTQDGLADNNVRSIVQDREGLLWFGTWDGGVTRYRPPAPTPPPVFIDAVLADRRYEGVSDIAIPSTVELTMFEFHGRSFKTRPEAMAYRYRLKGYEDWQTTHDRRVEYQALPRGTYTFEVVAVDRDLVYSETPATLALTVHLPYERIGLLSALGIAVVLVGWQTARVIRRDHRLQESNTALSSANKDLFGLNEDLQQKTDDLDQSNQALQQKTDDLTVEAALERVRAKALEMKESEELSEVSETLFQEFEGLGFDLFRSSIVIRDEAKDTVEIWISRKGYTGPPVLKFSMSEHEAFTPGGQKPEEAREQGQPHYVIELAGEELIALYRRVKERFEHFDEWYEEIMRSLPDRQVFQRVFFSCGTLSLVTNDRLSENDLTVAKRFADVFDFAYARFLELQEKEERNRELEIENALERVRAQALGMQESDELAEVSKTLFAQFEGLGFSLFRSAILIEDETKGTFVS